VSRQTLCRWAVLVALGFVLSAEYGDAAPKKSDSEVKITAKADKPDGDGKQTVTVTIMINKSWHIYANPVGLDDFANAATVVTVTGKNKLEDVKVDYPAGTLVKDKMLGNYRVYEEKVEIKAVVKRAKNDTGALEVSVQLMACNDKNACLAPATVKVPVE
jgi:DsbC/DsbD-like thiol-disulfide interchange protein